MSRPSARRVAVPVVLATLLSLAVAAPMPAVAGADPQPDGEWVQVGSYTPPFRRIHPAMAFDGAHTLLFGGSVASKMNGNGTMGDTWSFDGDKWIPLDPETSPPPRTGSDAVWDAARGELVLFGGLGLGVTNLADTWTWDGTTWTQEQPAHSPPARRFAGMAFDAVTKKVVLFGGADSNGIAFGDTWTWDGLDWTQQLPLASPAPRLLFGIADGSSTSGPVLFGGIAGVRSASATFGDTWTWDGPNNTWIPGASVSTPIPRMGAQMAYDAPLGKTILYGGSSPFWPHASTSGAGTSTHWDDTWTWDGTSWTQVGTAGAPRVLFYGAMSHDPVAHKTYLFGGASNSGERDDIWSFDGTGWVDPDHTAPGDLQGAMLERESLRTNSAILFGGQDKYYGNTRDTWRWDSAGWHLLAPSHSPPPLAIAAIAFDPAAGNTVLFGGSVDTLAYPGPRQLYESGETWIWDGTDWTQQQPATSPPARSDARMVYDAARGNIVLFGGADLGTAKNDTWTWDGHTWKEQHPATSPTARFGAAMTYDPVREEVVLFGGNLDHNAGRLDDTWTWDGKNWTEESPSTIPPPRAHGAMAFDPRSGSSILTGGCDPCLGPTFGDTWSWDGWDWTELAPASAPTARTDLAAVSGDTWIEGGGLRTRPLLMFGGRRQVAGAYDEGTNLTADLWAFNAPELAGGVFHVYGPGR